MAPLCVSINKLFNTSHKSCLPKTARNYFNTKTIYNSLEGTYPSKIIFDSYFYTSVLIIEIHKMKF
jgi:hypothetical protein